MKVQIYELIEFIGKSDTNFFIPAFQRKYKWKWNKEIKDFLSDIENFRKNGTLKKYFFGTIIIKENISNDNEEQNYIPKTKYILVDGQQRITTLILMCSAFHKILNSIKQKTKDVKENLNNLLHNVERVLKSKFEKFKLIRIQDQKIIEEITKGREDYLQDKQKTSNYYIIYNKFKNDYKKWNFEKIEDFYYNILLKIEVIVMEIDKEENEFLIFEVINSRGKILSPDDLIKNYIMKKLTESRLYKQIENLENFFIEEAKELEENKEDLLTDLYRQTLGIETGTLHPLKGTKLYEEFKKWVEEKEEKKMVNKSFIDESFVKDKFYDLAIFKYIFKEAKWSYRLLPLIKSKPIKFYSIMHLTIKYNSIFKYDPETKNNKVQIENKKNIEYAFSHLTKFTIARTFCNSRIEPNLETVRIAHKFKNELEKNKDSFKKVFNEIVVKKFKENTQSQRIPNWDEVKEAAHKRNYPLNRSVLKWIFIALEQNIIKDKIDSEIIEIEHIYPQNPSKEWKEKFGSNERRKLDEKINTIGNLNIVRKKVNKHLSNKSASQKKELLGKLSNYKIDQKFPIKPKWDANAIKDRTKKILDEIYNFWFKN